MVMDSIGSRLKNERVRLRLTQAKLGEIGGIAPNAQGHYEKGLRIPRADYLQKIGGAGIDVGYIISGRKPRVATESTSALVGHQRTSSNPTGADASVDSVINDLGECMWKTAATIAAMANLAHPSEACNQQMADNLRDFQSESRRFVALACTLGTNDPVNS
jgi:transcriptional regulator with XRE-family HTH domain